MCNLARLVSENSLLPSARCRSKLLFTCDRNCRSYSSHAETLVYSCAHQRAKNHDESNRVSVSLQETTRARVTVYCDPNRTYYHDRRSRLPRTYVLGVAARHHNLLPLRGGRGAQVLLLHSGQGEERVHRKRRDGDAHQNAVPHRSRQRTDRKHEDCVSKARCPGRRENRILGVRVIPSSISFTVLPGLPTSGLYYYYWCVCRRGLPSGSIGIPTCKYVVPHVSLLSSGALVLFCHTILELSTRSVW